MRADSDERDARQKLGSKRMHIVRTMGGNRKYRALRLDTGNFSWGSEGVSRKSRIISVVYNASNNELVRTNTLVKSAIVEIDATPFRQWYEAHYAQPLGRKKPRTADEAAAAPVAEAAAGATTAAAEKSDARGPTTGDAAAPAAGATPEAADPLGKMRSRRTAAKYKARAKLAGCPPNLEKQFITGHLLACIASRPGQCGRADGYILEGKELEFYQRKINAKKSGAKA